MLLSSLLLCALAGFCAKLVDERADNALPIPIWAAILCAIIYGVSGGLLSAFTPLSALFIALAIASLLSGKINHSLHLLGLLAFTLLLLFTPLASFDPWAFAFFLVLGLLDELELGLLRPLSILNNERLWVPAGALLLALWDASSPSIPWANLSASFSALLAMPGPLFLLAIVCFDLAYRLANAMAKQPLKPRPVRMRARHPR